MLAWTRQEGESAKAFAAFELYRDLGPERSVTKVAQELHKSRTLIGRWSAEHDWVSRVAALEARDQMIRRDAVEENLRTTAEDHARREAKIREDGLEARELAMAKTLAMLRFPVVEQRRRVEGPDGEEVVYELHPPRWSFGTAGQLYHLAVGDAQEPVPEDGANLDFSVLDDSRLARLVDDLEEVMSAPRLPPEPKPGTEPER